MEFILLMFCFLLVFTSVSFTYIWYQIRLAQKEVKKAIDACRDVVVSANTGRWM
jgi:hypothetical protein